MTDPERRTKMALVNEPFDIPVILSYVSTQLFLSQVTVQRGGMEVTSSWVELAFTQCFQLPNKVSLVQREEARGSGKTRSSQHPQKMHFVEEGKERKANRLELGSAIYSAVLGMKKMVMGMKESQV